MDWSSYFWGVATVPIVIGLGFCLLVGLNVAWRLLKYYGWDVEFKSSRNTEGISNYTLKHNIWYEKQRGPVFTGHWYFERGDLAYVNRWFAIGKADGTALMFFKKRNLGPTKKEA